jgi:hypothetical protein
LTLLLGGKDFGLIGTFAATLGFLGICDGLAGVVETEDFVFDFLGEDLVGFEAVYDRVLDVSWDEGLLLL